MHKPLAQALVMIAAAAVASDEPSSGRRLAARRGRRRPVKRNDAVKLHPTSVPWVDYLWRKDPATGRMACPWVEAKRGE